MKVFIKKALIYIVILIACAIGLDWIITRGLQRVDDFIYEPWTYIQKGNHNHNVLILGNSRAQGHIHPSILDSVCNCNSYNLGIEAYPMNMHLLKYNYYLQYNEKPRLIIYQVDLATIHQWEIKRGSNSEQFLPLFYQTYWRKKFLNLGYNKLDLYCPLYRYFGYHTPIRYGIIEGLRIKHIEVNPAYKGFKGWDRMMEERGIADEQLKIDMSNRFTTDADDLDVFEAFIRTCKSECIDIVLVYSPIYEPVEKQLTDREIFDEYMQNISKKYDITYLDYTKDIELNSNKIYYSSPGHLNLSGAELFTIKLAHDIDSIGFLEN